MSLDVLERLAKITEGETVGFFQGSRFRAVTPSSVRTSRDFERILALPRREYAHELFDQVRELVTKPGARMRLRDIQCAALLEALSAGGLFGAIGVGRGKTLIAALLPTILDKRAVILTTPGLVKQGLEMIAEYRRDFEIRDDWHYVPYTQLSSAAHADILEHLAPELIIADEGHTLERRSSARTKRFLRYMREHPNTSFAVLSGSLTKTSVKDFAHLLELALGEWTPLPREYPVLTQWAEALDVSDEPLDPGVLLKFAEPGEQGTEAARRGWQRRLADTRGVVLSMDDDVASKLVIEVREPRVSSAVKRELRKLQSTWTRPDGEELTTALEFARVNRQMRLGGFYFWQWGSRGPNEEWTEARRNFGREMRDFLKHRAGPGRDSPLLVERALERGEMEFDSWARWRDARELAKAEKWLPETEWNWIDSSAVDDIVSMVCTPCIVWTDITAVGEGIAEKLRAPYFGAGKGEEIVREKGDRNIVASIQSHGVGRNLQMFSRAVAVCTSPAGVTWEQLLGRVHRDGQRAPEVHWIALFEEDIRAAITDAHFIEQTTGNKQKLLTAEVSWPNGLC